MKKILLILSILAITNFAYAQKASSTLSGANTPTNTPSALSQSKEVQSQIKDLLVENEEFGAMAIGQLKSDPEAKAGLSKIYSENKGNVSDIMKSVMSDPKLSSKVMDWVNNNPKVLNKAMSLIKM